MTRIGPKMLSAFCLAIAWSIELVAYQGHDVRLTETPDRCFCYGDVVDADGMPIPDAKVTLVGPWTRDFSPNEFDDMLLEPKKYSTQTKNGSFDIQWPVGDSDFWKGRWSSKALFTVEAKGFATEVVQVGMDRLVVDYPHRIKLERAASSTLKVVDENGKPIERARVTASLVDGSRLPLRISMSLLGTTDETGSINFSNFNSKVQQVVVESEELGIHRVPIQYSDSGLIAQLPKLGRVKGKLVLRGDHDKKNWPAKSFWLASYNNSEYIRSGAPMASWQKVTIDSEGRFDADRLGLGSIQMERFCDFEFPFTFDQMEILLLQKSSIPDDTRLLELDLPMQNAKKLILRFVNEQDQPLNGLTIYSTSLTTEPLTNADGECIAWLAEGAVPNGQIFSADPYFRIHEVAFGDHMESQKPDVNGRCEPFRKSKARALVGRVVDPNGQVVSGATVSYSYGSERFTISSNTLSDKSGKFTLRGLPPDAKITVKAQKETLLSDPNQPLIFDAGLLDEIAVTVVPFPAAQIAGRVLDQNGKPVKHATVSICQANVSQAEGYSAEETRVDLDSPPIKVTSGDHGQFVAPPTTKFKDRWQVTIEAQGFLPFQSNVINGGSRAVTEGKLSFGEFRLVPTPQKKKITVRCFDATTGNPIESAKIVFCGVYSGRQSATIGQEAEITIALQGQGQVVAVQAEGYRVLFKELATVGDRLDLRLQKSSEDVGAKQLEWFGHPKERYLDVARKLFAELEQPSAKESTYFHQSEYFSTLGVVDLGKTLSILGQKDSEYANGRDYLRGLIEFDSGTTLLRKINEISSDSDSSAAWNWSVLALKSNDENEEEEAYGEAVVHLRKCSGDDRLVTAGYLARHMLLDNRIETATEIVKDTWAQERKLKELLEKNERDHSRGVARIFVPMLALIDPELALKLIPLTADQNEVISLKSEAVAFLSLEDFERAQELAKTRELRWDEGVDRLLRYADNNFHTLSSRPEWLRRVANVIEGNSRTKIYLALLAARSYSPGAERNNFIQLATDCLSNYQTDFWSVGTDPGLSAFNAIMYFDDIREDELDEVIFASMFNLPEKFNSYNQLSVFNSSAKLLGIRDAKLAKRLIEPSFADNHWFLFRGSLRYGWNTTLFAAVSIDPDWAGDLARKHADSHSLDNPTARLQIYKNCVSEIGRLIVALKSREDLIAK
jgi:Carboxypeptidase regulatory-like domain